MGRESRVMNQHAATNYRAWTMGHERLCECGRGAQTACNGQLWGVNCVWQLAAGYKRHAWLAYEVRKMIGCRIQTAYMARFGVRAVYVGWLWGTSHVWDATGTVVGHRTIHLFYVIMWASEVRIVISWHLWTCEAEIYTTARVGRPFDHRPSWI